MSGYLDLFIPFDKGTKDIPEDLKRDILDIRDQIVKLQSFSQKITPTDKTAFRAEEDTTRAVFHVCHHDDDPVKSCEEEKDIALLTDAKPIILSNVR